MIALLQAGYYAEPHAARYDAATMGMFVLIIAIGVIGFIVQARLQSVFKKYSKVQFPGGLTGAEVAEKMLRDNNIHNVKVTHVGGHLTDHFNPQTMTVNLSDCGLLVVERRRGGRGGPRVRPRRAARPRLRPADAAFAAGSRRAVRLDGRHVGHHPGSRHPRLDAERTAVLDRRGHDRHVGALLARHAARRVQRLGPRAWSGSRPAARCREHSSRRPKRPSRGRPALTS